MKFLILLLISVNITWAGLPPTTLSGESSATKPTTFTTVVPNYQATQVSGIKSRIETGNGNQLVNPSFEHATVATGWTSASAGTAVATDNTSWVIDGAKAISYPGASSNWSIYQDSTLYAAAKAGQNAEASVWVHADSSTGDIWVCPRVNGVSVTASVANGCENYTNFNNAQKLTVYPLYGATSTGIEVKASASVAVALDDAYLGDRRPSPLGITTTPWISYTPTTQGFGTIASTECLYKRVGSDLYLQCKFTTGTTTGVEARVGFPSGTTAFNNFTLIKDVGNVVIGANDTASYYSLSEPSVSYVTIGRQGTAAAGLTKINGSTIASSTAVSVFAGPIAIAEWQGDNNAFTTKCDDSRQCETVFSATAITTSGTVSNESLDFINGNCTAANPTVCTFNAGIFTVAPNCVASVSNYNNTVFEVTPTSTTVTIRSMQGSSSADVATQTFNLICQAQGADYLSKKISQQIIQSRDVPRVPGGGSIDTFSVSYGTTNSTTVCSASPCTYLDQIGTAVTSITRSGTGAYSLNTSRTYLKLKCKGNAGTSSLYYIVSGPLSCANCNALSFFTGAGVSAADTFGELMCQGTY